MDNVRKTDEQSSAVAKTENRVSLDSIIDKIKTTQVVHPDAAPHMTLVICEMTNGFIVIGKSAPADPENFNGELGFKFAQEDAVRQIWQLEGYALRERLVSEKT